MTSNIRNGSPLTQNARKSGIELLDSGGSKITQNEHHDSAVSKCKLRHGHFEKKTIFVLTTSSHFPLDFSTKVQSFCIMDYFLIYRYEFGYGMGFTFADGGTTSTPGCAGGTNDSEARASAAHNVCTPPLWRTHSFDWPTKRDTNSSEGESNVSSEF